MPNPVIHFQVLGKNGKRLQDFYSNLFDWRVDVVQPGDYGEVNTGAGGINGGIAEDERPHVTFYVEVTDLEIYLERAEKLGGKVILPPTEIPGDVTLAKFADVEGNVIGLVRSG